MGISKIGSVFKTAIIQLLVFQLAYLPLAFADDPYGTSGEPSSTGALVPAQIQLGDSPLEDALGALESEFEHFSPADAGERPLPNYALIAGQRHVRNGFASQDTFPVDRWDVTHPEVAVINFADQVVVEARNGVLALSTTRREATSGMMRVTHTLEIGDGELVFTGDPIVTPEFVFVPTAEGLRALSVRMFKDAAYRKAVPLPVIIPNLSPNSSIVAVEMIERSSQPRPFVNAPETLSGGDLAITIQNEDGGTEVWHIDLNVVRDRFSLQLLFYVTLLQMVNPDPTHLAQIADFLQERSEEVDQIRERAVQILGHPGSDQAVRALSVMAERGGAVAQIEAHGEIQESRGVDRDEFPADPSADGVWARSYAHVISVGEERNLSGRPAYHRWEDAYASALSTPLTGDDTAMASSRRVSTRAYDGLCNLVDRLTTVKGMALLTTLLTGAHIAGRAGFAEETVLSDYSAWSGEMALTAWHAFTTNPITNFFVSEQNFRDTAQYLSDPENLALYLPGAALMISLYFLICGAAGLTKVGTLVKEGAKAAFMAGARTAMQLALGGYLLLNRVQDLITVGALGQRSAFRAAEAGLPIAQRSALQLVPIPGPLQISALGMEAERNADALNAQVADRATRNLLAQNLAAALLVSQETGVDPATVFQQAKLDQVGGESLVNLLANPEARKYSNEEWAVLCASISAAAAEIINDEDIRLDAPTFAERYTQLRAVANRILADGQTHLEGAREVGNRALATVRGFGIDAARFLLLGMEPRELHARLGSAPMSANAAANSFYMGAVDYPASAATWALKAPDEFAFPTAMRVFGGQTEQALIFLGVVPSDIIPSLDGAGAGNPYPRAGERPHERGDAAGRNRVKGSVEAKRPQTLVGAMGDIARAAVDPNEPDFMQTWVQWIKNLRDGFRARVGLAALAFGIAFLGKDIHGFEYAWATLSSAVYIILTKIQIMLTIDGGLGVAVGYASVWPILSWMMKVMDKVVGSNGKRTAVASGKIVAGKETGNRDLMLEGVSELKALYAEGEEELPIALNIETANYDEALAMKLYTYATKVKPPLPNRRNAAAFLLLNFAIGTIISVVIYDTFQLGLVENGGVSAGQLAWAGGSLALNFFVLKSLSRLLGKRVLPAIQPAVGRVRSAAGWVRRTCREVLLGRQPVEVN